MRIAIASTGRFHVLDLARELVALGHEVHFYSYVPRQRAVRYGLPEDCHVSLFIDAAPYLVWHRFFKRRPSETYRRRFYTSLNRAVIRKLRPCEVFICMSGVYVEAMDYARKIYGATVYVERGSMHIGMQAQILSRLSGVQVSSYDMERESSSYEVADKIVVPSIHVAESFSQYPQLRSKIFVNPYGVDLEAFSLGDDAGRQPRRVLYVGAWSYQKGCDKLAQAVERLDGVELVHVGAIGDAPVPKGSWFKHHDPVDQSILGKFYKEASAFVLASQQEGLALVQAQALASGLPVVCTDRTGGADLRHDPELRRRIRIVPYDNVNALRDAIDETLCDVTGRSIPPLSESSRQLLSWRAYGERYDAELKRENT